MLIRIFVSGDMEERGLKRLTQKLLNELGQNDYSKIIITKKGVSGKSDFINKIGKLVENSLANKNIVKVFSLEDLDENDLEEYRKKFISNVKKSHHNKYEPKFAKHEIETWILADIITLRNYKLVGYTDYSDPENQINSKKKPKLYIKELFKKNKRFYKETLDGVLLLEMLDIKTVYNKCPSFKNFIDNIIDALNVNNPFIRTN